MVDSAILTWLGSSLHQCGTRTKENLEEQVFGVTGQKGHWSLQSVEIDHGVEVRRSSCFQCPVGWVLNWMWGATGGHCREEEWYGRTWWGWGSLLYKLVSKQYRLWWRTGLCANPPTEARQAQSYLSLYLACIYWALVLWHPRWHVCQASSDACLHLSDIDGNIQVRALTGQL